jgi:hypothetical protein
MTMSRTSLALPVLICLALAALPATAVIVDRVAITAGSKVITESEIIRRIRLAAFQNGVAPSYTSASRREAAQELIDQKLVEREMEVGNYVHTPTDDVKNMMLEFAAERYNSDVGAMRQALAAISLTPEDLEKEFADQADIESFLSLRFRPAVQVSDQDIDKYLQDHIASSAVANAAALSQVRAGIERILANQRADQDMDAWLQDQKNRTRIRYVLKELQ